MAEPRLDGDYPLISIVTAVRDGGSTVSRCLDSVAMQSYPRREHIVQDGASTDGTVEILRFHPAAPAWESSPDRGVYDAFNKALRRANGEWLLFLGADDFLAAPDALSRAADRLRALSTSVEVAYAQVAFVGKDDRILFLGNSSWNRERFRRSMTLAHAGVFHRRALFNRHGLFDVSYRIAGDYDFLLRELKDRDPHFLYDVLVAKCALGGLSSQPATMADMLRECARARRQNGLPAHSLGSLKHYIALSGLVRLQSFVGRERATAYRNRWRRFKGAPQVDEEAWWL